MNKSEINDFLPKAYDKLKDVGIANSEGKIPKTYRGYISSFGAAVSGGSLMAAIAFFMGRGEAEKDRTKLMDGLNRLIYNGEKTLFDNVKDAIVIRERNGIKIDGRKEAECKEKIIDAAIALKLAMNLYELTEKEEG